MIFGKRLSEYISFTKLFLGLILIVGIARLALSLGGVETSIARWLSITVVTLIAFLYYPIEVPHHRFWQLQAPPADLACTVCHRPGDHHRRDCHCDNDRQ